LLATGIAERAFRHGVQGIVMHPIRLTIALQRHDTSRRMLFRNL